MLSLNYLTLLLLTKPLLIPLQLPLNQQWKLIHLLNHRQMTTTRYPNTPLITGEHFDNDKGNYFNKKVYKNSTNANTPDLENENCTIQHLAIINFCGFTNKQAELEAFLDSHNVDFLLGTESHLDESLPNSEIFPSHYHVYRNYRNINGGSVFILVEESIPSSQIPCDTLCELIWVQLHASNHQSIILGSFYRPPNSSSSVLDDLSDSVQQIQRQFPNAIFLLGGDFNIPGIDWSSCSLTCSYLSITL